MPKHRGQRFRDPSGTWLCDCRKSIVKRAPIALHCGRSRNAKVPCGTRRYKVSVFDGGDGGTRTPDPLHAKQVLYQLSYIPTGTCGDVEDCTRRSRHLSKQMRKRSRLSGLAMLACAVLVGAAAPLRAAVPVQVAVNRCNSETVDDAYARIRDFDRHAPGGSSGDLLQRIAAITSLLATLREEREILDSVCASDEARAPLFAQIAATTAWALTLESDVAVRLNASCPAAAQALAKMMLSDAWLAMANVVNDDSGGPVPAIFTGVIPKVQSRALAVGLTLPPWADASAYWRDRVHAGAKADIATCPSPSAAPTPGPR